MKFIVPLLSALVLTITGSAQADTVSYDFVCELENLASDADLDAEGRLFINFKANADGSATLKEYMGHLQVWGWGSTPADRDHAYYAHFVGKNAASSLSPRARTYTDAEYFRFRDFDASTTTSYDGGGFWGYFVVAKAAVTADSNDTFSAHYVAQSGDHFGGTFHFSCKNRW